MISWSEAHRLLSLYTSAGACRLEFSEQCVRGYSEFGKNVSVVWHVMDCLDDEFD